jgi:hypothetical protein
MVDIHSNNDKQDYEMGVKNRVNVVLHTSNHLIS